MSRIEFTVDVLVLKRFAETLYENGSVKKTSLYYSSRIRWNSFKRYLDWLQYRNYIQCNICDGIQMYALTDAGKTMFDKLSEFLPYVI